MDAHIEGNHAILGGLDVAAYFVHAGSGHAHHGRIASGGFRHGKDAIHRSHRSDSRLIHVHFIGASVGQNGEFGIKFYLRQRVELASPPLLEVAWHGHGRRYFLGIESHGA